MIKNLVSMIVGILQIQVILHLMEIQSNNLITVVPAIGKVHTGQRKLAQEHKHGKLK